MSIKVKLTIIFLAIALIPTLLVVAISFQNYRNSLEAEHMASLEHLTIYKADRIETFFAGLKTDIKAAQNFYNIRKNLPLLSQFAGEPNNVKFLPAKKTLDEQLQPTISVWGVSDIMLVNPQGKVVYANKPKHWSKDLSTGIDAEQKAFTEGKKDVYISDVYFDKAEDNRFEMLITAPVFDLNNAFIGVIVLEVDMTSVYNLIQDTTGLGHTGEVLAVKKNGNQVQFLNPLRHDPDAALKRKASLGDATAYPAQQAIQGKTGAGIATDYRGKKVIAAWRYIPSLDWGLVAKIDAAEAFEDVANLQKLVTIVLVLIFLLAGLMAFSIARSIAEPVQRLAEGAEIIGSGNLDYKVGSDSKDEIGQLSRSFDKMTHDLRTTTTSRDELNREIIERKHVEAALRESEDRFRTMANAMQQLAWIAKADGHIFWYNQRWYDYTGTTPEQMEGWGWQSMHDPVLLPKVMEQWNASLTQGTPFEMEFPLRGADGQFRQFLTRGVPLKDTQGRVVQWFGTNTDVNDIKQAQKELRESQADLSRAQTVAHIGSWRLDIQQNILTWSDEAYRIFGISAGISLTYEKFLDTVHPDDRDYLDQRWKAALQGEKYDIEHRIIVDGQIKWVREKAELEVDKDGTLIGGFGTVQDITALKQANEAVRKSEEQLRMAANAARIGMWSWIPGTSHVNVSANWRQLFGVDDTTPITFETWRNALHPDDRERAVSELNAASSQHREFNVEYRVVHPDGTIRWLIDRGQASYNEQGQPIAMAGVNVDNTERKQAEEALRENEARLSLALDVSQLGIWELNLVNHKAWRSPRHDQIFGYDNPLPEWTYEIFLEHVLPEDRENVDRLFKEAVAAGHDWQFECRIRRPDGQIGWISARGCTYFDANGKPVSMLGLVGDITQRKQADAERELTVEFLRIVNESTGTRNLIEKVTTFFQKESGCEAIGIRLKEGDDYPYFVARGFPKEFVLAENCLCTMDSAGQILRDSEGYPIHECMCGNIINGRFDPSKQFFTKHGSFWTNCTTELLATTTEKDRQARTRNRCNGQGYESVALIPLRFGDQRLGLLQLNDKRKGQFSPETIQLWERLADQLATAVAKFRAEDKLSVSEGRYRRLFEAARDGILILNADSGQIVDVNPFIKEMLGYSHEELLNKKLWEIGTFKNIVASKESFLELQTKGFVRYRYEGLPLETKDGRRILVEFVSNVYLVDHTKVIQCNIRDITERIQAQEALRKAHDELELRVKERTEQLTHTVEILQEEVTQRQAAEESLRSSEERYRSLTFATTQVVWTTDAAGQVDEDMPSWREFTGQTIEEIKGWGWINSLHPDDREGTAEIWSNAVKNKSLYVTEYRIRRHDGQYRYVAVRGVPVMQPDGAIREWIGTCTDITESKRMQDELRESAIYSRNLLEASLDPLVTINASGQITDVNEATEHATGLSREVLIGNDFSDYFTDPQKAREGYKQVFAKGFVTDYPLTIRHTDGTLIDVLYNATVFKNEAGEVQGVFATARDVTERKAAEQRQAVTNSLLELFAKKTSRKDYLADTVNVIREWSGCEFIGIRIKDDEGNIPYESHSDFDSNFLALEGTLNLEHDHCICIRTMLQKPLAGEKNCTTPSGSFYCNDSHAFLQGLSKQQIENYRGNCMKWGFQSIAVIPVRYRNEILGVIHIADQRKGMVELAKIQFIESTISPLIGEAVQRFNAEAELEKYRLHLEELVAKRTAELEKEVIHRKLIADDLTRSNKDLEQFAYVASHDLQEPLRAVAGFVVLLKHQLGDSLDGKKLEYMNFAVDGVARMQTLINGLLEYSRIGSRGRKPEPTDAKTALDRALAHLLASIKETGAEIIADNLPTLNIDAVQLAQLFQNLISNAIKFRGESSPRIHISATHDDNSWRFAVTDNGIGIEAQYADRIFLIFQRLHTRSKYPGTGIGLALCKKIVERHHGKIWVESKPGTGSTFYFTIPDKGGTN